MFESSKEQRHIKEICLHTATEISMYTNAKEGNASSEGIIEAAEKFETFFYTAPKWKEPDTNKEKED